MRCGNCHCDLGDRATSDPVTTNQHVYFDHGRASVVWVSGAARLVGPICFECANEDQPAHGQERLTERQHGKMHEAMDETRREQNAHMRHGHVASLQLHTDVGTYG